MKLTLFPLAAALLLLPGMADAHHGWMQFDEGAEVTVQGTVTDFHFVNPHCVVEFEVKDEAGHIRKWQGEFANPGTLSRLGWTAASLEVGEKLIISGHPGKGNVPALHVTKIRLPSGELKLELRE
jgi:hypothetical protein